MGNELEKKRFQASRATKGDAREKDGRIDLSQTAGGKISIK